MSSQIPQARVAVIGGSGVYDMDGLSVVDRFYPDTPFGKPSDEIVVGELEGQTVAFLPRHGKGHRFLPSEIPQQANFYALKMMGVELVIALSAVGSLKEEFAPREFALPDQIIDRTKGRASTFFGKGIVAHVSFAHPFSENLRKILAETIEEMGVKGHRKSTYVCMEGPAFSTQAESHFHRGLGADLIGMTAIPEAKLAREAEMAYALVAMVTDYDCWKEDDHVSVELVIGHLMANADTAKKLIRKTLPKLKNVENDARSALKNAIFTRPEAMTAEAKARVKAIIRKYVKDA